MTDNITVADERDLGAFIPSYLDDFGLNPYQFRIYCRLARRAGAGGQCWESINNMAENCQMNRKTVMKAITGLIERNMVHQLKRPGETDLYRLTHRKHWVKPGHSKPPQRPRYQQFLETAYWADVRSRVLARDKHCQYCGKSNHLQVHHLTYQHHGKEHEHLEDLVTLCQQCHSEIHLKNK